MSSKAHTDHSADRSFPLEHAADRPRLTAADDEHVEFPEGSTVPFAKALGRLIAGALTEEEPKPIPDKS